MELIRGLHNLRPRHRGCAVTVGAFDGIHLGHQGVLTHVQSRAAELSVAATAIVFEPLPREYFEPLSAPPRLTNFRERLEQLSATGIDQVLVLAFNSELRSMSAEDFLGRVFVDGLGARHIALGDDFRFGNSREGDFDYVSAAAAAHGYAVSQLPTVEIDGGRVSSTRIRGALADGDFSLASRLLGRPFTMSGRVMYGKQLGRTLGTPTANIGIGRLTSPLVGVYAVRVTGAGLDAVPGVANIGVRPTVDDGQVANLEVHVLDRKVELYGARLQIQFEQKLRDEKKFESLDALTDAIAEDKAMARTLFGVDGAEAKA